MAEEKEPTQIDLSVFLAAAVIAAGGELLVPYDDFVQAHRGGGLAIDIIDDGATIALSLVEEIPE
jgi:hypothetical protein